jgi:Outer membrane protein beta-barrel domain
MVRGSKVFLTAFVLIAGCSLASAQEATIGAGKVELGGFPGGGTFFTGGDDNTEVNFNVYTSGGGVTYYINPKIAVEGEFTGSVGWAQDVFFHKAKVIHVQMPGVWSYMGNVVVFPQGTTGKRVPIYVTGGAGALSLQSRVPTKQFGYDVDTVGWQTFTAENIGAGVKIFRAADAPNWGFRIDYRLLFINSKSGAPAFFAQSKSRMGSRVYVGMLYTWKR